MVKKQNLILLGILTLYSTALSCTLKTGMNISMKTWLWNAPTLPPKPNPNRDQTQTYETIFKLTITEKKEKQKIEQPSNRTRPIYGKRRSRLGRVVLPRRDVRK